MTVLHKTHTARLPVASQTTARPATHGHAESIRLLVLVAIMALMAIGWRMSPYRFGVVVGDSMTPSLKPNHLFLMEMNAYRDHPPGRGDIVVFEWNGETVIKRVVGAPGETLWLLESTNDTSPLHARYVVPPSDLDRLADTYRNRPDVAQFRQITVPEGHVYVVGDAQKRSLDSRHFGPIAVDRILGRVLLPSGKAIPPLTRGDSPTPR